MNIKIVLLVLGHMLAAQFTLKAQEAFATRLTSTVEPLEINVGDQMTTNLIFPYSVIGVDRGSKSLLVQKAKGVDNILQVKAGSPGLPETNLTVVTADGGLYSFRVTYHPEPFQLNLSLQSAPVPGLLSPSLANEARLKNLAAGIAVKQPVMRLAKKNGDIQLAIGGIYIDGGNLFLQVAFTNSSQIRYDIEQLRFYIRDKKQSKRTASQELEQLPIYYLGDFKVVPVHSRQTSVFVLPKFTIPDGKVLVVQMMERGGGRHLTIKLNNRHLLRAVQAK